MIELAFINERPIQFSFVNVCYVNLCYHLDSFQFDENRRASALPVRHAPTQRPSVLHANLYKRAYSQQIP